MSPTVANPPTSRAPGGGSSAPVRTGTGSAQPLITYSAWDAATGSVQVSAFVPGLDPGPAQCRLTLTKGGVSRSAAGVAQPSSSTMQCGTLSVARAGLSAGTWTAVVTYSSTGRSGTSAASTVEVPS